MGRSRDSLKTKALACAMSLVLAVGLTPLPAFAEIADEASAVEGQLVVGMPAVDDGASDAVVLTIDDDGLEAADYASGAADETDSVEAVEQDEDMPALEGEQVVDGVKVAVRAEAGVFPAGAELSVETVPVYQQQQADAAVDEVRDENRNVAASYTFDIKVINPETGEEYQPAEGQTVSVSFALAEVSDENLETQVYHVTEDGDTGEMTAESLDVNTETTPETGEETTAVVETDGFSLYTVEFTYNTLEYVLPGDTSVPMSEILTTLGLIGEVTAVEVSDTSLFSASDETGEWTVTAHQAFSSTEWMKVTINGVVYEITVTDDQIISGTFTESTTWADGSTISSLVTVSGGTTDNPVVITVAGTVNVIETGRIAVAPGSHVIFRGTDVNASKLDFHDRASGSTNLLDNQAPDTDEDLWVEFDTLTIDFNQLYGRLCFEGSSTNPMQVDFTNTVIKNSKIDSTGVELIRLNNCYAHFRNGTKIINNEVGTVAGTYNYPYGTTTIYLYDGCEISGNTCKGPVLSVNLNNNIVMYGGTIKNNTVTNAQGQRGVIENYSGQLDIYGGVIQGNTSPYFVLYNYQGTLNIYGGTFTGNSGLRGGVVTNKSYSPNIATTNIYGGTFTGNTASYGGAIYNHDGVVNIVPEEKSHTVDGVSKTAGGSVSITGNTATYTGGGIATGATATLTLGGSNITVKNNTSTNNKGADLAILSGYPVAVSSALSGSDIGFTLMSAVSASGTHASGTAFAYEDGVSVGEGALTLEQPDFVFDLPSGAVAPYTITIQSGIEHGTITADRAVASEGDTITLTATPDEGYALSSISVSYGENESAEITEPGDNTCTFTMPASNVTVTAVFSSSTPTLAAYAMTDTLTASVGDVSVTDGPYTLGQTVTATAPDKSEAGYTFLGWYNVTGVNASTGLVSSYDSSNRLSERLSYTFELNQDTSIVAVYQARGKANVKVSAVNGAQYRIGTSATIQTGSEEQVQLGSTYTLTAVDTDKVLYWCNDNNKVLGTQASLSIPVTSDMTIYLLYRQAGASTQSCVQFESDYGQVLTYKQYSAQDTILFPVPPTKLGYTFKYWVIEGTQTKATEEAIHAAIGADSPVITVKPYYEKNAAGHTVTVSCYDSSGTGIGTGQTYEGIETGAGYTVTAPSIEGYAFKCWTDADGLELGTQTSYFLQVRKDVALKAVYVGEDGAGSIVHKPVIALTDLFRTDDTTGGKHKVTAIATRSVPEGYTVLEQGMLYGKGLGSLTNDTFIYGSAGVLRFKSSDLTRNGAFDMNVSVSSDSLVVYFRGYMLLKDEATGNTTYYYSAIKNGSYSSLEGISS